MTNATPQPTAAPTHARAVTPGFACVVAAWEAHEAELRGYVRHRLADAAAADDLVQEVFLKAMHRENALCGLANPRAWLFQVARNALVDRARTAHPAEPIEQHEGKLVVAPAVAPAPVDALADCVELVMRQLPAGDADILRACDIDGQLLREFAAARSLSLPAAKSRLLRARLRLRERLVSACQVRFDIDGAVCCHVQPARAAGAPDPETA
jgi:RNA polymerase sigma-70 factor, ECF subfamily